MNITQLYDLLIEIENKELPVTITGNDSFCADITNVEYVKTREGETFLLLYENSYQEKTGKHLLLPVKTINDLLIILHGIKDKNMQVKGRGVNGVLVSLTNYRISYIDDFAMLDLYDASLFFSLEKAKKDVQSFIENLHID